jgi:phosphohistidine swiveling domain-containing protein
MIDPKKYNIMIWATRPYSVMWGQGYCDYTIKNGCKFFAIVRIEDGKADYFTDKESFESACRRFGKKIQSNSSKFLGEYEQIKKSLFRISTELSKKAGKVSDKELNRIYLRYWNSVKDFAPYLMFPHYSERVLEPMLKNRFPEDFPKISSLTKSLDHLKIEKVLIDKGPSKAAKEFGYLNTYAFFGKPYSEEDLTSYHVDKEEVEKKLSEIRENKKIFNNFIKKLKEEDKKLCFLLNELVFIRTDRIDAWKKHSVILFSFVDYIAEKISPKLSRNEIITMSKDEISDFLAHGKHPSVNELLARGNSEDFMPVFTEKGILMIHDKNLKKQIIDRYKQSIKKSDEVSGMPACKGIVRGVVKIYTGPKSIVKDESGFIMVAKHTSPQDLPFMKRAIAIVTDEGGVTSHAAIVSRELKIPGVTGTKTATSMFKNGDYVEVNADKGIVRKIR